MLKTYFPTYFCLVRYPLARFECRRPFLFCVIERREIFSSAAVHASLPPRYPQSIPTLVMFSSHLPCSAMDLEVEGATWICGKQFFESKEYSMGSVALFGLFVNRIYLYKLSPYDSASVVAE